MANKNKDAKAIVSAIDEVPSEDMDHSGEDAAAQEMMDAMKAGDAKSFKESLKNFIEICMDSYDSEESSDESDESES